MTAALTATGCASYRLGPVNPAIPAGQAIEVGLFENATPQSGLTESVNASIRRELHRDGTFGLATGGDGDVLRTGNITAYRTTVRLGGDLASAERQALPLLANDLARKTVALLAEGEW